MSALGAQAYADVTKGYETVTGTPEDEMLQRVGRAVAATTGKSYVWEFRLLEGPEKNAFCLPGGKVAVFTGLLPVSESEDGLAVVLGHEIAHATLQHSNERLSQPTAKKLLGIPLKVTTDVWGGLAPNSRRVVMGAFGIGGVIGEFMPYSQEHEYEADEVGLRYMGAAGFPIEEAPRFWQRMLDATPNPQKSDALSTHPDAAKRIRRLNQLIARQRANQPRE
jgi:predicted Zn-dependent protease